MGRETLGVAVVGAASAVVQERVRGRVTLVAATAAGAAILAAYASNEPELVLILAALILIAAALILIAALTIRVQ